METEKNDKFMILKELGRGSYGNVYLLTRFLSSHGHHPAKNSEYALKVIAERGMSLEDREAALKELRIMHSLYHPNIVSLLDSFQAAHSFLLVLELCEDGDLRTFLDNVKKRKDKSRGEILGVDEVLIVKWTEQLASGLEYLHQKKILHRDLKPQNIFLKDNYKVKIGDLGIARQLLFTREMSATFIGTPLYISPEIYQGNSYSYKTDVWSLGCCVYEMMALDYAFPASSRYELFAKIIKKDVPPLPQHYSPSLQTLVLKMLQKNPDDRLSPSQILQIVGEIEPAVLHSHKSIGFRREDGNSKIIGSEGLCFQQSWRPSVAKALSDFLRKKQADQFSQLTTGLTQGLSLSSITDADQPSTITPHESSTERLEVTDFVIDRKSSETEPSDEGVSEAWGMFKEDSSCSDDENEPRQKHLTPVKASSAVKFRPLPYPKNFKGDRGLSDENFKPLPVSKTLQSETFYDSYFQAQPATDSPFQLKSDSDEPQSLSYGNLKSQGVSDSYLESQSRFDNNLKSQTVSDTYFESQTLSDDYFKSQRILDHDSSNNSFESLPTDSQLENVSQFNQNSNKGHSTSIQQEACKCEDLYLAQANEIMKSVRARLASPVPQTVHVDDPGCQGDEVKDANIVCKEEEAAGKALDTDFVQEDKGLVKLKNEKENKKWKTKSEKRGVTLFTRAQFVRFTKSTDDD